MRGDMALLTLPCPFSTLQHFNIMIVIEYKLWLTENVTEAQAHEQVILNAASSLLGKKGFPFGFWTWLKRSASILLPIKCISEVRRRWWLTSALLTVEAAIVWIDWPEWVQTYELLPTLQLSFTHMWSCATDFYSHKVRAVCTAIMLYNK